MSNRATGPCLRTLLLLVLLVTFAGSSFGNFADTRTLGSFRHALGALADTSFGNFADGTTEADANGLPTSFGNFPEKARKTFLGVPTSFGNFEGKTHPGGRAEFVPYFSAERGVRGIVLANVLDSS